MDRASILAKFDFYSAADPSVQAEITREARAVTLQPGTYFYREGSRFDDFALVGSGDIRVFKVGERGHEITLYHVQDGDVCLVNMLCVFLDQPTMANAVVEAPTEAVVVPSAVFRNWIATNADMRRFAFAVMAQRLVNVMVLVEGLAFHRMDERLARLLMQRFSHPQQTRRVIAETHEELARELGTVREVVSRVLKEFERQGAIAIARGRVELNDDSILRSLASGARGP